MRVYQGSLKKGQFIYHGRSGKRIKVPKLVRMHSNEMEVCPQVGPYHCLDMRSKLFVGYRRDWSRGNLRYLRR
jgi:hypothetical protein